MNKKLGLYIHIPFCKQKCYYCDFTSFAGQNNKMEEYVDCLVHEIELRCKNKEINSIYFGGGTPSALSDELIEKLLKNVMNQSIDENSEITFEMNPESVTKKKAQILLKNGVNRISLGLQSSSDSILKEIGRVHNFVTFVKAYRTLREVGFTNINVDIMFGLPNQTIQDLTSTLNIVTELKPEHISAYSLILEEGTAFYHMKEKGILKLPDEDLLIEMMEKVNDILKSYRYERYEISNYALKGYESKHNYKYWDFSEYIACGVSASGFEDGIRYTNVSTIDEYIQRIKKHHSVKKTRYRNKLEDNIEEFIFMGLRTNKGVDIRKYKEIFNESIFDRFANIIDKYEKQNLLKIDDHRMILTEKAFDVSNYIMSDFLIDR